MQQFFICIPPVKQLSRSCRGVAIENSKGVINTNLGSNHSDRDDLALTKWIFYSKGYDHQFYY